MTTQLPAEAASSTEELRDEHQRGGGADGEVDGSAVGQVQGDEGIPAGLDEHLKLMGKSMTTTSEVTEIKKGPIPHPRSRSRGLQEGRVAMAKMIKKQK